DDILGLLVLSVVVGASGPGGIDVVGVGLLVLSAGAFIIVASVVGIFFFSRIVVWIQAAGLKLGLKHGGFSIALAITFFYAFVAELIGLSAIVGAFLAGVMFASTPLREDFQEGARYLGSVFTPIFFISMGVLVDVWAVVAAPELVVFGVVLIAVAIGAKLVGCGIPAKLSRMTARESVAVGLGMAPRGEVGLIVALTALTAGVIADSLFSVIVLVMIVVSVVPAPFFKRVLLRIASERRAQPPAATERAPPPV
ncbi:MAG TPA: cation:proton antiporter, partial [Thermoanaerobaculia bacterium]